MPIAPWSISIKTVGGHETDPFTVSVSPEDDLTCLHNEIERVTGLKMSQQRLIYRGRLLSGKLADGEPNNAQRIGDVAGLGDGQTIHLVPKPVGESSSSSSASTDGETSDQNSTEDNEGTSMSGSGTASLLAALLGLGSSDDDDNNSSEETSRRRGQRERLRTTRSNRSRRQVNYRLTAEDIVPPDPGSMEPVRQGLMTMHTLLSPQTQSNASGRDAATEDENRLDRPDASHLEASRQWYRGQWIDCLDTVNQWLEATIVDIVRAEDVLPPRLGGRGRSRPLRQGRTSERTPADPAVSANDFEGRRLLLLEPCDENDSDEEDGELAGFRERDNNRGVELLLVHYNGWPHRWDEWLRSDSERIRPFRTRTRHPSSAPYASPSPQSVFHAAPATHIADEDDAVDRQALLPELSRVVSAVNNLLTDAISPDEPSTRDSSGSRIPSSSHMPWIGTDADEDVLSSPIAGRSGLLPSGRRTDRSSSTRPQLTRQQLETLAPLLDRLGRTLTDAAPHVAALAQNPLPSSLPTPDSPARGSDNVVSRENSASHSTGLFSLLSRDSRRRAVPSLESIDASTPLLGSDVSSSVGNEARPSNPDHVDFVNGMVNTHRDGRNGRRGQSDDGAGLLGAYLAAASLSNLANGGDGDGGRDDTAGPLGRIVRQGGTGGGGEGRGGGGIDIHIHAIVTGPGVGPTGGLGLAMLGAGIPPGDRTSRNSGSASRNENAAEIPTPLPTALQSDNDDMGLFSELYSESPQPTDHHVSDSGDVNRSSDRDTAADSNGDASVEPDESAVASRISSNAASGRTGQVRRPSHGSRSNSATERSTSRRGNSFGRVLRRAMGRRSSRTDSSRSVGRDGSSS